MRADRSRHSKRGCIMLLGHELAHSQLSSHKALLRLLQTLDPRRHTEVAHMYETAFSEIHQRELREAVAVLLASHLAQRPEARTLCFPGPAGSKEFIETANIPIPARKAACDLSELSGPAHAEQIIGGLIDALALVSLAELRFLGDAFFAVEAGTKAGKKEENRVQAMLGAVLRGADEQLVAFARECIDREECVCVELLAAVLAARAHQRLVWMDQVLTALSDYLLRKLDDFLCREEAAMDKLLATAKLVDVRAASAALPRLARFLAENLGGAAEAETAVSAHVQSMFAKTLQRLESLAGEDHDQPLLVVLSCSHYLGNQFRAIELWQLSASKAKAKVLYDASLAKLAARGAEELLGKHAEFFAGLARTADTVALENVQYSAPYGRVSAAKALGAFGLRELRRSAEAYHRRLCRDVGANKSLVVVVWRFVVEAFAARHDQLSQLLANVYRDDKIILGFGKDEAISLLSEIV